MRDPVTMPGADAAHDPVAVLEAVLAGFRRTGTEAVCVVRPVLAPDGRVVDAEVVADSDILSRLAGTPSAGRRIRELMTPEVAERIMTDVADTHRTGEVSRGDVVLTATGSGLLPVLEADADHHHMRVGELIRIPSQGYVVLLGRDVTEARAGRRALLASELRYRRLVEHSSDPILVLTAGGVVTYASPAVRMVLHREPEELLGRPVSALAHPDDAQTCADLLADVVAAPAGESRAARLRTQDPAGAVGWVAVTATNWSDDDAVAGVVLNVRDITEQRAAEERLLREALQDSLTGLANRRWFMRALEEAVGRSTRTGAPFAVLVLDVDGFKRVNDTLGHPAGDALLADLADRLTSALRPADTAARLGGDEFVVIAEDLHSADDALTVARRVLERCSGRYRLPGVDEPVPVTVSIGVATSVDLLPPVGGEGGTAGGAGGAAGGAGGGEPADHAAQPVPGEPGAALFQRADAALYRAKRQGRNRIEAAGGPRPNPAD